jgi:hypothetical protein
MAAIETDKACLLVSGVVTGVTEERELNRWWNSEHMEERLSLPGFNRASRYYSANDNDLATKYLVRYEVDGIKDLRFPEYLRALNDPTEDTKKHMGSLTEVTRSACWARYERNIGDGVFKRAVGNWLLVWTFVAPVPMSPDDVRTMTLAFSQYEWALGTTLLLEDEVTTRIGSRSLSYDNVDIQNGAQERARAYKYIMLSDLAFPFSRQDVCRRFGRESGEWKWVGETLDKVGAEERTWEAFQLLCSMEAPDEED